MSAPASPPARRRRVPSWLDLRFVLGVLLILGSVVGGARLFAIADRTAPVWAVARDLGSGTVLARADLRVVRVRLPESGERYLAAGPAPVGRSLNRDVGAGELLPRAAVIDRVCGSEVSVPVAALHVPATVRRGVRVDVFATPREGETTRVLAAVTVQEAVRGSDLGGGSALVVRVADELAPAVVRAVRTAEIDVVVVGSRAPGDGCGGTPLSPGATPPPSGATPPPSGGLPSGGPPAGGVPSGGPPAGGVPSGGVPSGESAAPATPEETRTYEGDADATPSAGGGGAALPGAVVGGVPGGVGSGRGSGS